jgi:hypothetical protein
VALACHRLQPSLSYLNRPSRDIILHRAAIIPIASGLHVLAVIPNLTLLTTIIYTFPTSLSFAPTSSFSARAHLSHPPRHFRHAKCHCKLCHRHPSQLHRHPSHLGLTIIPMSPNLSHHCPPSLTFPSHTINPPPTCLLSQHQLM